MAPVIAMLCDVVVRVGEVVVRVDLVLWLVVIAR